MNFSSLSYIFVFLPTVLALYFVLGKITNGNSWPKVGLLAASLVFSAIGGIQDFVLLLISLCFNLAIAYQLLRRDHSPVVSRRFFLIFGISANILFLCYFKYGPFFLQTSNALLHTSFAMREWLLPRGISFYTIYQIMFLVDCYECLVTGQNWLNQTVFASFFPYVTMGPIVRWKQVVPQLDREDSASPNADHIAKGVFIFAIGLVKKVVLADSFFRWADAGFSYSGPMSLVGSWLAALAFTGQLYFDFSGYTDMAIGTGLMLNVSLPQNFNAPFRATSIIDFWRRWHITLTNFITTYLYTPMVRAMSHPTLWKMLTATFLSMLIAGFWHGANWTFLVFGGLHGLALALNQLWRKRKLPMPNPLAWLFTFVFVVISFVFFRSANVSSALQMLSSMFSLKGGFFSYAPWSGIDRVETAIGFGWMILGSAVVFAGPTSMEMEKSFKPSWGTVAFCVMLAVLGCLYANGIVSRSFVYQKF